LCIMCDNPECDSSEVEKYEYTNHAIMEYRMECKECGYYEVLASIDYLHEFPCL